jgi:hypothetical protein
MKIQDYLRHVSTPAKVFATALILLIAVPAVQGIIIEVHRMFAVARRSSVAREPKKQLSETEERAERIRRSATKFLPNGSIHLIHTVREPGDYMSQVAHIYDVNDNLLWEGPLEDQPYEYLSWAEQVPRYHEGFTLQRMRQIQTMTPEFSRTLEIPVGPRRQIRQFWRYSPASDLFAGYGSNGEKIGYAGSTGFTDSKSKAKPFGEFRLFTAWCPQGSSVPTLLWQTRKHIYQIDFEKQHVEPILESTGADIKTINLHAWRDLKTGEEKYVDPEKYRPLLHCATEDGKHHLLMRNPGRQLTITIPKDWQGWANYHHRFTATKQGIFLSRSWVEFREAPDYAHEGELYDQWWSDYRSKAKKHHVELYKLDIDGSLDLLTDYTWSVPPRPGVVRDRPAAQRYAARFSPPLYDAVIRLLGTGFWVRVYDARNRGDFFCTLAMMILEIRPGGGVLNWLLSAAMMGFVFWHGWPRRTSVAGFAFWVVFVGALNLAGLLTYLALNHTAVIKCPACGGRRGLARPDCAQCHAQLPAPKRGKLDLIFSN